MEIESTQGPAALVNANADDKGSDDEDGKDEEEYNTDDEDNTDDDNDEEEVDSDKENNRLRAYELNRLKLVKSSFSDRVLLSLFSWGLK